jgi:hypothetical protein
MDYSDFGTKKTFVDESQPAGDLLRVEVKLDAAIAQLKRLETLVIEIHRELNNAGMMTVGKQLDI